MSSPNEQHRCLYNRLHRRPSTIDECEERNQNREEAKRTGTPYPEFERESSTLETAFKRRRGRGHNATTTPNSNEGETSGIDSPSPLKSRSTNRGTGLFTPNATQEQEHDSVQVESTPMASLASTQIVPETPLSQLRQEPAFGEAGRSSYQQADTQRVSQSTINAIEHTVDRETVGETIHELRQSRNRLTLRLEESTASNERLRRERQYLRGEVERKQDLLLRAGKDRDIAMEEPRERAKLKAALGSVLMLIVVYVLWCWHYSPDMAYIRKRRWEALTE